MILMCKIKNVKELYDYLLNFDLFLSSDSNEAVAEDEYVNGLFIKTADGSYTIRHKLDDSNEKMHNDNGAITESVEKFLKPSEFDFNNDLKIFDICSGLGYNTTVVLDSFLKFKNPKSIHFDLVEISKETLAATLLIPNPLESHALVKDAIKNKLIEIGFLDEDFIFDDIHLNDNISINQHVIDARELVYDLEANSYDVIFLDPFSPAKTPELVTVEFVRELAKLLKDDGLLITYSSSAPVRSAFFENGFYLGEGPIFGRSNGGTLASFDKDRIITSLPNQDERNIAFSDVGIPYRDPNLNLTAKEINTNRQEERKARRSVDKLSSSVQTPKYIGIDVSDLKLKRRLLRNTAKVGINDLKSKNAMFLIEPQYDSDIKNSRDRIIKMRENFNFILEHKE